MATCTGYGNACQIVENLGIVFDLFGPLYGLPVLDPLYDLPVVDALYDLPVVDLLYDLPAVDGLYNLPAVDTLVSICSFCCSVMFDCNFDHFTKLLHQLSHTRNM